MDKIWQLTPKIKENIIKDNPDFDPAVLQILNNRGIKDKKEIEFFLKGDFENLIDPFLFKNMEKAVDKIIGHIKKGSKICVFGDYDADGITSSALLYDLLALFKADVFVYIPDRIKEGYGLNIEGLKNVINDGADLIITVDGGIRNKEAVEYAKKEGREIVITDHHPAPEKKEDMPDCLIINPQVKGENYPTKTLAGVGVAFKLAQALIERSKLKKEQKHTLTKRLLDLVAIGTVADCMVLLGENRILVKEGLEVLNNTRRLGLKELIKVSCINNKELQAWNIGFQIAPRLNASSRIASGVAAFELLVSKDEDECNLSAKDLDEKNAYRQKLTEEAVAEVEEQIKDQAGEKIFIGIADEKDPWNEGIVGLVAGKITERYYKPCIIITKGDEEWKGSGRSIDEFNLAKALEACKDVLIKQGGHAKACGLSVEKDKLAVFSEKIRKIAKKELKDVELLPKITIDCEIGVDEVKKPLVNAINRLAPFGQGNPEPKFLSRNVQIRDIMKMGAEEQHIKFKLGRLWALAFGKADIWSKYKIGDLVDVVYNVGINEFNGRKEEQLKVIDIKLSSQ
ncbi:single-stranded-DNA-specific exonuclease RecJ [Candidatus Falkowbacteria bacterium]|nr:single-stranded-DNA-specific exonuclease RecJ [Candidatus Falkowbacteria bacterium]